MTEITSDEAGDSALPDSAERDMTDQDAEQGVPWVMAEPKELSEGEETSNPFGLVVLTLLFGLLWFGAGPRYFLVVLGLLIMIFLHELGHFVTARWTGMKATQFFLFMGPRLFSFRRGETEYGMRLLPLGAFVRIIGMNNLDPCSPEDEPRAFKNKSYPRKMLVMTAGSLMHFIQAVVLFMVLSSVIGVTNYSEWTIGEISALDDGSNPPAQAVGLQPGETIVSVDGIETADFRDLSQYLQARPGEEVELTIRRETDDASDPLRTASAVLAERTLSDGSVVGFLGVAPEFGRDRQSPVVGVQNFGEAFWASLTAIPRFLSPGTFTNLGSLVFQGSEDVAITSDEAANRPVSMVGAVRIAGQARFDWTVPIGMLAFINIFVGIFNLMPMLPLDGGHVVIATYERLRSRKGKPYQMDVAKLLPITYAVVAVLGFVMLTTLWLDIVRPIS